MKYRDTDEHAAQTVLEDTITAQWVEETIDYISLRADPSTARLPSTWQSGVVFRTMGDVWRTRTWRGRHPRLRRAQAST